LGLTEAAQDAVRKWKFKASTLNGKPVEVLYILTVRFNLQ
jgi:outer membrane biosynthesis protein TonB